MSEVSDWLLLFQTGALRFGFDVDAVERVIPALEINPLPGAPASVRGVAVVSGAIVPVVDPSIPFNNGAGDTGETVNHLNLTSRFVIVRTPKRTLAIIAEEVDGVRVGGSLQLTQTGSLMGQAPALRGISVSADGLIYVADPERLISEADEIQLLAAMAEISNGHP